MISKIFLAYILMALGAVPASLVVANHTAAADTEVPGTLAHSTNATSSPNVPNAAHAATSPTSTTSENTPASSRHSPEGETTNGVTSVSSDHAAEHHAELPPSTICHSKHKSHGVESHHCRKALDKVAFAANQTLDKFSSLIFANYKTCNVHIHKPMNATLQKVQLSLMVETLTTACHSVGGVLSQSNSKFAIRIERSTKENVHEVNKSICKKEKCPLTQSDCLSAFYQLPTNAKGVFVNGKGKNPFVRVTSGNCTVTASTTDLSAFTIPRQFVLPTMKKLLNECDEHPGKIYFGGGTKGYNGDIWLSARPANKDLCN
ncbi:hypothetical protein PGTUg99_023792 [Puccinia graminis f. sp. tritici]|uniref:Uncharacterized protein n=1 Tax=Puccinia graminis f. sp. tritici TaxID=56615 RepID=A0A5B0SEZ1_PUCGR|nr:hypothetical protein PGTUg99_023792 [Puccinia graminis f. sp. tritici]